MIIIIFILKHESLKYSNLKESFIWNWITVNFIYYNPLYRNFILRHLLISEIFYKWPNIWLDIIKFTWTSYFLCLTCFKVHRKSDFLFVCFNRQDGVSKSLTDNILSQLKDTDICIVSHSLNIFALYTHVVSIVF